MNRRLLAALPLVIGLTISGCGKSEQEQEADVSGQVGRASTQEEARDAAAKSKNMLDIGGGMTLPAGFMIRSKAVKGEGAAASRVVRCEFRGTAASAANELRKTFQEHGFKQASATDANGGTLTRIYRAEDGQRVRAVLVPKGPELKVELAADSAGLVTFYWQESGGEG